MQNARTHLVDGEIRPLDLLKILAILQDILVRREEDVEFEVLERSKFKLPNDLARPR